MARIYSKEIAKMIDSYLTNNHFSYDFMKENGIFLFGVCSDGAINKLKYSVIVHNDDYNVYVTSDFEFDKENVAETSRITEFICRANYGLRNGGFEIDYESGNLVYKTYTTCNGVDLPDKTITDSIYVPAAMYEKFSNGIYEIINSDITPKEAIDKCMRYID